MSASSCFSIYLSQVVKWLRDGCYSSSEKALTERAFELRTDLETAASELSRLFDEIGWFLAFYEYYQFLHMKASIETLMYVYMSFVTERKNKMENGNKALIENFHTQLAQQLEILRSAVEVSVKQQHKQLEDIERNTNYFVSEKDKVKVYGIGIVLS